MLYTQWFMSWQSVPMYQDLELIKKCSNMVYAVVKSGGNGSPRQVNNGKRLPEGFRSTEKRDGYVLCYVS